MAVATLTAILAIVKPTFDLTNKIVHYQYALTSYQALSFDLQTLILTIRTKKEYGRPEQRQFYEIAERTKKIIFSRPKEQPDPRFLASLQDEINRRFPVEGFYIPES